MVDFHSHFLPELDDGARDVAQSLEMLSISKSMGVNQIVATPHFYAYEESPQSFLRHRERSYNKLLDAMNKVPGDYPDIYLGAEVLYFPGMSDAEEIPLLKIQNTDTILIEPPMVPWSDIIIDEIEQTGKNHHLIPVIAHIDRYMQVMEDNNLIERFVGRKVLIQCNASFFLKPFFLRYAADYITDYKVHLIGSDCHNTGSRAPNMAYARDAAYSWGLSDEFDRLSSNARYLLKL